MASLLESGNNLKNTMILLNLDDKEILKYMQQGNTFENYLLMNGKGLFFEHFSFFIGICTLSDAIKNSIQMMQMESEFIKKLKKESAYPVFILTFSFIAIYVFTTYIVPMLLNSFTDMNTSNMFIELLTIIKVISIFIFVCIIFLLSFLISYKLSDRVQEKTYIYIVRYIPFIKQYIGYTLSGYLIQLNECGMSTKEAFLYLIHFKHKTLTIRYVKDIYAKLIYGEELTQIIKESEYFDAMYKQYFLTGIYSSNIDNTLKSYMDTQWILWMKDIKKLIIGIQIISYLFVGILLICVYQIMLLPMEMITSM